MLEVRNLVEMAYTDYWVRTPMRNSWRSEAEEIAAKYAGRNSTKPESETAVPASKKKLINIYDTEYFKWLYVIFNSNHRYVAELHKKYDGDKLVDACGDMAYIMITVHSTVPKKVSHKILTDKITGKIISETLEKKYNFEKKKVDNLCILLKKDC